MADPEALTHRSQRDVTYLIEVTFPGEPDDDLGVFGGIAEDACDLVEGHWRVEANVVRGFDRLMSIARQILDDYYPADTIVCDRDSPDPGPRLAAALRDCEEARQHG